MNEKVEHEKKFSSEQPPRLTKSILTKKIILYELIGFGIIILLLWVDEIFDLPHVLFGTVATPINWSESILETAFMIVLCALVAIFSKRHIKQIKYLEGFLYVCSFCKKIRVNENWLPIEQYLIEHSEAEFSHGLCPKCTKEHYWDFLHKNK